MGRDERWPALPFFIVRGIQTLLGVIALGMTANILSYGTLWWAAMGLFISIAVLIWMAVNFLLFHLGLLLPLVVVIVDGLCFLFLLVAMAGTADSGVLAIDCTFYGYTSSLCTTIKGSFAMELLAMFAFLGSLVFASITLHRHRGNLFGRARVDGGAPTSAELSVQTSQTHKPQQPPQQQQYQQPPQQQQYQQPPQQQQYQQPPQQQQYPQQAQYPQQMQNPQQTVPLTTYPAPVYNSQQPQHMQPQQPYTQGPTYEGFVSPATSPPPTEMQHTGGYSDTSAITSQNTGGWPASATEMPGSSHPTGTDPRN